MSLLVLGVLTACSDGERGLAGPATLGRREPGKMQPPVTGLSPYVPGVDPRFDPDRAVVAARTPPPLSGGTLAVAASGQVIAADPDRDVVYLIDVPGGTRATLALSEGDEPGRVLTVGGTAYVALRGAAQVAIVDLASRAVLRADVCANPRGLAVNSGGRSLLLACAGGELLTLSLEGKVVKQVWIADDLRDVGVDDQGVWVTRYRSAELLRIAEDGSIAARQKPSDFERISLQSQEPKHFSPTQAARTIADHAGHPLMLHQRAQSSVIDIEFGGYGGDQECSSGIVHATLSRFDGDEDAPALPTLPSAVLPIDVALSPDGSRLAVVSPGGFSQQHFASSDSGAGAEGFESGPTPMGSIPARQLALLDATLMSGSVSEPTNPPVNCFGDAPQWEHVFPGEVESVAFTSDTELVVLVREPSELRIFELDAHGVATLKDVIGLSQTSVLDTGHQLFYQSAGLGIACASCHGEGHEDGHVWAFNDIGPRRTQSLLGGILGSAPFHWDADLTDFRSLVDEVMTRRMGGPALSDSWTQALGSYIDAQGLRRSTRPVEPDAVQRGKALFEGDRRCTQCHAGESYGGRGRFDVGTGGAFKVPSLLGVAQRLPLMHDGCARTLEQRFDTTCGGRDHGGTQELTPADIADLVAFLSSL